MATIKQKPGNRSSVKSSSKAKKPGHKDELIDDPNAVHDVYTEVDLDPAYDETIADDIAFDYDGRSGDPGDRPLPEKSKK